MASSCEPRVRDRGNPRYGWLAHLLWRLLDQATLSSDAERSVWCKTPSPRHRGDHPNQSCACASSSRSSDVGVGSIDTISPGSFATRSSLVDGRAIRTSSVLGRPSSRLAGITISRLRADAMRPRPSDPSVAPRLLAVCDVRHVSDRDDPVGLTDGRVRRHIARPFGLGRVGITFDSAEREDRCT